MVISNPVLRVVLHGINLLGEKVVPQTLCSSMEEAMQLARHFTEEQSE